MGKNKKGRVVYKTRRTWKLNCKVVGHCWEWQNGYSGDGYGIINNNGTPEHAHRFAYRLFKGTIRNHILHKCDNKRCVRPAHLKDGTHSRNIKEAWARSPGLQREREVRSRRMKRQRRNPEFERRRYAARHPQV